MFPDNTVLINFAIINRMDLLERLANGNGQWCATVSGECAESARYPGLAALSTAETIFGEPLYPTPLSTRTCRSSATSLPALEIHRLSTWVRLRPSQSLRDDVFLVFLLLTMATRRAWLHRTASPSPVPGACCKSLTGKSGSMPTRSGDTYRPLELTIEERHRAYGTARPSTSGSQRDAFRTRNGQRRGLAARAPGGPDPCRSIVVVPLPGRP
jgi:hypothetical protein